ncbi:MAG: tryptophan synthase subunit alpha [Candidatus Aminicenantia bacterium]
MSKLCEFTLKLRENKKKAFIPFFTAFYPTEKKFGELLLLASSSRADIIEIGIPFSDPIADGKYIQHSSEWALKNGFKFSRFISFIKEIRKDLKIPLIIMSYLNPIFRYGFERFAEFMAESEINGIIFPDLPVEEEKILGNSFKSRGIAVIKMVAPSTESERIRVISEKSDGFIYLVSVYGVTGVREKLYKGIKEHIFAIRKITKKPLYAGFGISNPAQASSISKYVDGIIIGSAVVKIIMGREENFELEEVEDFLKSMRSSI